MDRNAFLEAFLDRYSSWYDITRCSEEDAPLAATAAFHEHNVSYALIEAAQMWTTDRHEYVYVFTMPELTEECYDACFAKALALGEPLVKPEKGHMSTNIVALFICDSYTEAVAQKIRKCRVRKNFQFSLKGWMEVHVAAVCPEGDKVVTNPDGRNENIFLTRMLHPKKKRLSFSAWLKSKLLPKV